MALSFINAIGGVIVGGVSAAMTNVLGITAGQFIVAMVQTKYGGSTCSSSNFTKRSTYTDGTSSMTHEVWTKVADGTADDRPTFTIAGTQSIIQLVWFGIDTTSSKPFGVSIGTGSQSSSGGVWTYVNAPPLSGESFPAIKSGDLFMGIGGSNAAVPAYAAFDDRLIIDVVQTEHSSSIGEVASQSTTGDDASIVALGYAATSDLTPDQSGRLFKYSTNPSNDSGHRLNATIAHVYELDVSFDPNGMLGLFGM